jgi:hypothetical protein
MGLSFKSILATASAIVLGIGLGTAFAWHSAAAITVEDNSGNPDVAAPLADPDDAGGSQGSGGIYLGTSDQGSDSSSGSGWHIMLDGSSGGTDQTQSQ